MTLNTVSTLIIVVMSLWPVPNFAYLSKYCTAVFKPNLGPQEQYFSNYSIGFKSFQKILLSTYGNTLKLVANNSENSNCHNEIYTAFYMGKKVFIKVYLIETDTEPPSTLMNNGQLRGSSFSHDLFLRELLWTQVLANINVGPKLLGFSVFSRGRLAIVTEFVEGEVLNANQFRSNKGVDEYLKTVVIPKFLELGIYPADFQGMISKDNKFYVIDPTFFSWTEPGNPRIVKVILPM